MSRPNFRGMVQAQGEIIAQTAKVMALLSPDHDGNLPADTSTTAVEFAQARLTMARKAIDAFERAMKGGA